MSWSCDIEDGPKVYSWTEPVARKEYICCECKWKIVPGQQYFKAEGLWDEKWSTFRQHLICLQACMYVRDKLDRECIALGALEEYYEECKDWLITHKKEDKVKIFRDLIAKILRGDV